MRTLVSLQAAQFFVLCCILLKETGFRIFFTSKIRNDEVRKLFNYSSLVYLANLVTFFTYKIDFWFVDYYVGKSGLGIYSLAAMLAQLIWLLPNAISLINLTEVSHDQIGGLKKTIDLFKISAVISIVMAVGFWIFCKILVARVYGEQFSNVPDYMFILFMGVVPFAPLSIISSYLAGINKYAYNLLISVIGVIVCITLDIILIPKYGITGACIASACSYSVISILLIYYFSKIGRVNWRDLFLIDRHLVKSIYEKSALFSIRQKSFQK